MSEKKQKKQKRPDQPDPFRHRTDVVALDHAEVMALESKYRDKGVDQLLYFVTTMSKPWKTELEGQSVARIREELLSVFRGNMLGGNQDYPWGSMIIQALTESGACVLCDVLGAKA